MSLDSSIVGLSKDKMQKVSAFRISCNMILAQSSQPAMTVDQAVRYLQAAKFDTTIADSIFTNYHRNQKLYSLTNLSSQKQLLNTEIRSRKLEILGARDNDGAQLLLFTPSRHDNQSCDRKAAMQLLFLLLDQISESFETRIKGVTLLVDLQGCSPDSYDLKYTSLLLSVLEGGYPLYLHLVYVVGAPGWFNVDGLDSKLLKKGKIKPLTIAELPNHISIKSLPSALGGSHLSPTKVPNLMGGVGNGPTRMRNGSKHGGAAPPITPPPRRDHVNVTSNDYELITTTRDESSLEVQLAGNVNKKMNIFQQPAASHTPTQASSHTPNQASSHTPNPQSVSKSKVDKKQLNGVRPTKPLPPPKVAWKDKSSNNPSSETKPTTPTSSNTKIPIIPSVPTKSISKSFTKGGSDELAEDRQVFHSAEDVETDVSVATGLSKRSSSDDILHMVGVNKPHPQSSHSPGLRLFRLRTNEEKTANKASRDNNGEEKEKKGLKSLVAIRIFQKNTKDNNDKEKEKEKEREKERERESHDNGDHKVSKNRSPQMLHYENYSIKPTRPLVKLNNDHQNDESNSSSVSRHKTSAPPMSPPIPPPTSPPPPPPTSPPPPPPISPRITPNFEYTEVEILQPQAQATAGASSGNSRNCYANIFLNGSDTVLEDEGDLLDTTDEIIYENFGPNKGNRWMSANELQQYISGKDTNGLSSEYFALKNEPLFDTSNMFKLSHNLTKNRYKDVVCYDSTRVVLNAIPGQEGSDYIHANYVSGYNKPQSTILTQGPLKRTVNDFWRMLWEKEVFVIVMATKCVEMAKLKCAQYWPDGEEAALYGDVSVRVVKSQTHSAYELRELSATRKGITRTLMHYQFLAWPDYGVPSNGSDILDVLYAARHMQESFSDYVGNPHRHPVHGPPVVIHCSAGIGRSGTFAALDYCIDELRMTNKVNVQNSVRILRQQRAFSIQTDEQYRFCYQTVLEYALYLKSAMKM